MELTREEAQSVVYEESPDWKKVEENIVDTSRWSIYYAAIHHHLPTDKYYKFCYSVGATESQDEQPFEYEKEPIKVPEVKPVEKLVTVWEVVK